MNSHHMSYQKLIWEGKERQRFGRRRTARRVNGETKGRHAGRDAVFNMSHDEQQKVTARRKWNKMGATQLAAATTVVTHYDHNYEIR